MANVAYTKSGYKMQAVTCKLIAAFCVGKMKEKHIYNLTKKPKP